jgi:hypothetical protein
MMFCSDDTNRKQQFKQAIAVTAIFHKIAQELQQKSLIKSYKAYSFTEQAPDASVSCMQQGIGCVPFTDSTGYNLVTRWGTTSVITDVVYENDAQNPFNKSGLFDSKLIEFLGIVQMPLVNNNGPQACQVMYSDTYKYLIYGAPKTKLITLSMWGSGYSDEKHLKLLSHEWQSFKEEIKKDSDDQKDDAATKPKKDQKPLTQLRKQRKK